MENLFYLELQRVFSYIVRIRVLPFCSSVGERPINVSTLSEARFRKSVKSGRAALRAFDRAV
jgi:hypothetical protein